MNDFIEMTLPDMYGQCHPVNETIELIQMKLKEFEIEVLKLPQEITISLRMAIEKCPKLVNDNDFKIMFLRCEVFNVDLAALRYAKYWDKRRDLFGDVKAFLPMTQAGACQDDAIALGFGFVRILPGVKDPSGRPVLMMDPSRQDKKQYTRESMTRALWYVIHSVLTPSSSKKTDEDSTKDHILAQQKGIVVIGYPNKAKSSQIDRQQIKMNIDSFRGYLPIRMSAIHMCHPPTFFKILFPIVSIFMGERLRKRVRIHSGSVEHVLKELESPFGLTKDKLPSEIGGTIVLNHDLWLQERAKQEKENERN